MLALASTGSCVGPQNETGHPADRYRQLVQVPLFMSARGIGSKICVIVFLGWHFDIVGIIMTFRERLVRSVIYEVCCVVLVSL